jgi:hypothetical protein
MIVESISATSWALTGELRADCVPRALVSRGFEELGCLAGGSEVGHCLLSEGFLDHFGGGIVELSLTT